jgi:hypothetical protein
VTGEVIVQVVKFISCHVLYTNTSKSTITEVLSSIRDHACGRSEECPESSALIQSPFIKERDKV